MGVSSLLSLPEVERVRYERNTIRQAVCELRFPTLPEIEANPPREFVKGIRRSFPSYEAGFGLKLAITDRRLEQLPEPNHRYVSASRRTVAWLRPASLGVETREYVDFETFLAQVMTVTEAARPCLDTDFFTRIGLRYINVLPEEASDPAGWVNHVLIGCLAITELGALERHWTEVRGKTTYGGYTFRYGLTEVEGEGVRFVLDYDFYSEGVEWDNALEHLRGFNAMNFRLYSWSISRKTLDYLGKPSPKRKG